MEIIKRNFYILVLILLSFIPLFDLFQSGLPVTHDGQDHVARIANFYENLQDGNVIPRWAPNLNWGYGHPVLMFLYPLSSYFASLFHFLGFSLVDSAKLVFAVSFIASGFTMYLWSKNHLGKDGGIVAAILYIYAPYRFVDMYVRGAIGEHVAFIFPPLILYFLFKLSKSPHFKFLLGGSLSFALFILAHNAISFMFMPFIFIYALYLLVNPKNKRFLSSFIALVIFGFSLSAFFWIPAFFEGKYTLRDIVTKNEYRSRFVEFNSFLYGKWSYGGSPELSKQVGIVQWLFVVLSVPTLIIFYRKKKREWVLILGLLGIFCISLFLMTSQSEFIWKRFTTLQKFQFPWRFLTLVVFSTSVIGGFIMYAFSRKYSPFLVILVLFFAIYANKDYWHAKAFDRKSDFFYASVYDGTTDTGESAPIWSVRFMEKRPKAHMEVIEGNAIIKEVKRTSTIHRYNLTAKSKVRIKENTLYFPGWNVFVDEIKVPIEFQDPRHRGLITFTVGQGDHDVNIRFSETKLRLFSNIVSLVSFVLLIFLAILKSSRIWRLFR